MDTSTFINAATAFFIIIDPIGAALIFHGLLPASLSNKSRYKLAFKACAISLTLILLFGLYGQDLLNYIGISIEAMRISGGLLLFYTAFYMIVAVPSYESDQHQADISVFPMTIPLLAGPGSLTLSILLFSQANTAQTTLSIGLAVTLIMALSCVCMMGSHLIKKVIGHTGDEILRRFLGVLLAALAIQFIYEGIANLANS